MALMLSITSTWGAGAGQGRGRARKGGAVRRWCRDVRQPRMTRVLRASRPNVGKLGCACSCCVRLPARCREMALHMVGPPSHDEQNWCRRLTSAEAMKVSATGLRRGITVVGNSVHSSVSAKTKNSNSMIHHCAGGGRREEGARQRSALWVRWQQGRCLVCHAARTQHTASAREAAQQAGLEPGVTPHLVLELEPRVLGVGDDVGGLLRVQREKAAVRGRARRRRRVALMWVGHKLRC